MSVIALAWLSYEIFRLLWQPQYIGSYRVHPGGIDLGLRQVDVEVWFAGRPLYQGVKTASYPPATQLMLWPFVGWLSLHYAIWLWLAATLAALVWLIRMVVRESGASAPLEGAFIAVLPLSMYATGATIGNGQLTVQVVALLLASTLLLRREPVAWRTDLLAAAMMILALAKPSLAAPFFLLTLFLPRRLRPALLVVGGYVALTLVATAFQPGGPLATFRMWLESGARLASRGASLSAQCNVHAFLGLLGWQKWNGPASLAVLGVLGLWILRRRTADTWILLGVTGLATHFWTYHGWYDDLVLLPAMIALYRIGKTAQAGGRHAKVASVLFAASLLVTIAPGGHFLLPKPWNFVFACVQMAVMLAVLGFLIVRARREE